MLLAPFFDQRGPREADGSTISQGGTHFRSICHSCNTELLGREYDPELAKFANTISGSARTAYESGLSLPESLLVWMKPQRVARAVAGHVMAANAAWEVASPPVRAPFPSALRAYLLDYHAPLPHEVEIYYWVYPHRHQVVVKGAAKVSFSRKWVLLGHIIKFFPLGFWILWSRPQHVTIRLPLLVPERHMEIDEMRQVCVNLRRIPRHDYPEGPADDEVVFFPGQTTSIGLVRKPM